MRVFLVLVVALQCFIVMMTVEDWDVRFLAPVLPCIFALAALGFAPYLRAWQVRYAPGAIVNPL
jgi:hypothetical protein